MVTAKWKLTHIGWKLMPNEVELLLSAPSAVHDSLKSTAGKVFLSQFLRAMAPKNLYSLLCCMFYFQPLILFILFFRDLFSTVCPAWEREPRSLRFIALLRCTFFFKWKENPSLIPTAPVHPSLSFFLTLYHW